MNKKYTIDDLSKLEVAYPSICIPRVFSNITKDKVFTVFKNLKLGYISHIDMVLKKNNNGHNFQRVFIHFKKWFITAHNTRLRILNNDDVKVIYDDPWFWKIFINHYPQNKEDDFPPLPKTDSNTSIYRPQYAEDESRPPSRPPSPPYPPSYSPLVFPLDYVIDPAYLQYIDTTVDYQAQPKK